MLVSDLFSVMNTDCPRIIIYDFNDDVVFTKHSDKPLGRCSYRDCSVAWIYRADSTEIALRITKEN